MKITTNNFSVIIRITGLLLFMAAASGYSYAQETRTDDEIDLLLDELFFSEEQLIDDILAALDKSHFLYSSFTLNSNTYFSGRDSGIDQFNFYPQLSYYHPSGFNMSLSGLYYENFDPNWDFTSISLGYLLNIDSAGRFYVNPGYTRYFFSDGSDIFTNSVDINLGIRNRKKTIGTALFASYLFGSDEALQMNFITYGRLTLLKARTFHLKFRPQLNFLVASQTIALQELNSQTQQTEFVNYNVFALLNTQLNLPISLVSTSWNIDVGYSINFPRAVATENDLKTTGFFTVSLGYLLQLKK